MVPAMARNSDNSRRRDAATDISASAGLASEEPSTSRGGRRLRESRSRPVLGDKLRRAWSKEEDEALVKARRSRGAVSGPRQWCSVAASLAPLLWSTALQSSLAPASPQLVELHGASKWNMISEEFNKLGLGGAPRDPKACRLRWSNQLDSRLNHGPFTEEENRTIIELHRIHGNKWALIAAALPGRTGEGLEGRQGGACGNALPHSYPIGADSYIHAARPLVRVAGSPSCLRVSLSHSTSAAARSPSPAAPTDNAVKNQWNCKLAKALSNSASPSGGSPTASGAHR